jgi:hypothetical protein
MHRQTKQRLATAALAYATYLTAKCPCARIMSCHKWPFVLSIGLGGGIVLYDNLN